VVEDDERAEAEAYPPREVRLVQARDPEGEAEHGEVDLLLRRVGVGDTYADAGTGGQGNAAAGLARRSRAWKEPVGGGVERA